MKNHELIGKMFPKITAYSLAKTEVRLPDMAIGKSHSNCNCICSSGSRND